MSSGSDPGAISRLRGRTAGTRRDVRVAMVTDPLLTAFWICSLIALGSPVSLDVDELDLLLRSSLAACPPRARA